MFRRSFVWLFIYLFLFMYLFMSNVVKLWEKYLFILCSKDDCFVNFVCLFKMKDALDILLWQYICVYILYI